MGKANNIDEYIAQFPGETGEKLELIRNAIHKAVPAADETISYGMPTFRLNGKYLVYFAAFKNHISVYPLPAKNTILAKEFSKYKTSGKGTVQFPLDQSIPLSLIVKIARFWVKERSDAKSKK